MLTLLIALLSGLGFLLAYATYGRWLGRKVFRLTAQAVCPSQALEDGVDYVPSAKGVVFGHHFTSIAGTGPIVGPALAVMWGWLPALLWVVLGSIFIGAVHDFGSLVVSLRHQGKSVGDIAGAFLGPRARVLFLGVLCLSLWLVLAIFGLVMAVVFRNYPAAIFPCVVQVPLAMAIGWWMHRKGVPLLWPSLVALVVMVLTVVWGDTGPLHAFNAWAAGWSNMTWVLVLLAYSAAASVMPVWILLQPRDYINSLLLVVCLALITVGLVVAGLWGGAPVAADGVRPALEMAAPVAVREVEGAPMIFPFLFVTIACGACSGFHCLVASGTSSKQLRQETDARFVGYGSMLLEGFLAVLVILACCAGLGLGVKDSSGAMLLGETAWHARYGSWAGAGGLAPTVAAFVDGAANFLQALHLPRGFTVALMGVLVASFAGTTLDTACRLQRYIIQELAACFLPEGQPVSRAAQWAHPLRWLENKWGATLAAIATASWVAYLPVAGARMEWGNAGKGGTILWPLFASMNQLLAGLAFLVVAFWLRRTGRPLWMVAIPGVLMLVVPGWAMSLLVYGWFFGAAPNFLLGGIGLAVMLLEVWMLAEAAVVWRRGHAVAA